MDILNLILRWAHIFSAVALAGGLFFQCLVQFVPGQGDAKDRGRRAWVITVIVTSFLLLLSGLINTARISIGYELPFYYHIILGIKIVLAIAVMYLAARLAGRSAAAQKMRENASKWLNITVVAAALVLALASVMGMIDRTPKETTENVSQASVTDRP